MKNGDIYKHFKGNEYLYMCIASPITEIIQTDKLTYFGKINDAGTAEGEEVNKVTLYEYKGFLLIDKEVPHVIYIPTNKEREIGNAWARRVDDFFGIKVKDDGEKVKRFTYVCPFTKMD